MRSATFRDPVARDRAWVRYYARRGARVPYIPATWKGVPKPAEPEHTIGGYQQRLAAHGYDPRDFAQRAQRGAALQDALKARPTSAALRGALRSLEAPVIRSTACNGSAPQLHFTADQVFGGR
jgi:hypothetical protein